MPDKLTERVKEILEREQKATLKRACDQRDAAAAERDAAVGQVAVLREALQSVTNYFWGTEPPVLKEGDVQAEVEEALASSAPLVAARDAEIEARAISEIEAIWRTGCETYPNPFIGKIGLAFADWLHDNAVVARTRAQEKRKAGTQAH